MILNGLGSLSAPLYLFEEFFSGKATEYLIGQGIKSEHFKHDRLGRDLDKLFEAGPTDLFVGVASKPPSDSPCPSRGASTSTPPLSIFMVATTGPTTRGASSKRSA
jgi:transposase